MRLLVCTRAENRCHVRTLHPARLHTRSQQEAYIQVIDIYQYINVSTSRTPSQSRSLINVQINIDACICICTYPAFSRSRWPPSSAWPYPGPVYACVYMNGHCASVHVRIQKSLFLQSMHRNAYVDQCMCGKRQNGRRADRRASR